MRGKAKTLAVGILSLYKLNRATLAHQLLQERTSLSALDPIERIVDLPVQLSYPLASRKTVNTALIFLRQGVDLSALRSQALSVPGIGSGMSLLSCSFSCARPL